MVQGLRITIDGQELMNRIVSRLSVHEAALGEFDARIERRRGDLPFDCHADDLQSFGELQAERGHCAARVAALTLLRDKIVAAETYDLGKSDLRLLDLVPADASDSCEGPPTPVTGAMKPSVIDGLRLTFTGSELRQRLEDRMDDHRGSIERWTRARARTPEEQTDDDPILPEHICENEAERHEWRIEVLEFIRDHIEADAVYRLGEENLEFAELLPSKPGWLEQDEYEERTRVGFCLERLARR
jgi:hypothetical protein